MVADHWLQGQKSRTLLILLLTSYETLGTTVWITLPFLCTHGFLCAFAPETLLEELPLGYWGHFARKSRELEVLESLYPKGQPLATD